MNLQPQLVSHTAIVWEELGLLPVQGHILASGVNGLYLVLFHIYSKQYVLKSQVFVNFILVLQTLPALPYQQCISNWSAAV